MNSVEIRPSPALRPYVQLIWSLELDVASDFGPPDRILPDGIVELVLHYRDPMLVRYGEQVFAPQPRSSLVSQTRRFLEIAPRGPTGLVSVRFRPWGASAFLGVPVSEIADRVVAAEDLWGAPVRELEERLAAAPDTAERVTLVERFLLARLDPDVATIEPAVRAVWDRGGRISPARLARDVGVGERTLQRTFARALGMAPRSYARLTRFLRACSLLRRAEWETLAEVGYRCGYYDQPHFNEDFRALSGLTPTEFLAAERLSHLELD